MPNDQQEAQQQSVVAPTREARVPVVNSGPFEMLLDTAKFAQLQRIGTMYARSKMVPSHFQGDEASCMVAVQMAMRLDVDPFMFLQKTFVVGGKPGMEAQLAIALVNTRGPFEGPIDWNFDRDAHGKVVKAMAFATHAKTKRVCSAEIDWALVEAEGWNKKAGSKWLTMREQMFAYRSAVFLARRYCPEVLMGMSMADELEEIDITPAREEAPQRQGLKARLMGTPADPVATGVEVYNVTAAPAGPQPIFQNAPPAAQEATGATLLPPTTEDTPQEAAPAQGPQIPFPEIMGLAKRAKNPDQSEVVLDALNDPGYTDAQRADVKMILNSKSFAAK